MRRIFTLLTFTLVSALCLAQDGTKPTSRLSRDTMLIGDQIEWLFNLKIADSDEFYVEKPEQEPAPGVETIKPLSFDTVSKKKGILDIEGSTVLTAFDSGSFFLPPIIASVSHADGSVDTIFFDGPVMEVTTIPIDTATFELHDIKGQIRYPLTFKEILLYLAILAAVAALAYTVYRFIKMKRENRSFFGAPVVKDPAHIVALRDLERIRSQKLWQNGKQKQFYSGVTDAMRLYLAQRYGIPALEQTTAEIFSDLDGEKIDGTLKESLKDLFNTADFVKFAKHKASDEENEAAIPTAVRFINETYMQQVEEDKNKEK